MGFLPDFSIETWTLIIIVTLLIAVYGYAPYGFFKKAGIQGPKPWPFIGTFLEYRKGVHNFDTDCFKKYGRVWGIYDGRQPLIVVMDTAIIKTVFVKLFYSAFVNRRLNYRLLNGPLKYAVSKVEDEEWSRIRGILSPSFTSARLKEMYTIMMKHSSNLLNCLRKKAEAGEVIQVKDVFGPYSMDVVASTAFSVDLDSINDPSDPLAVNIRKMMSFNYMNPVLVLMAMFPLVGPIADKMDISFFPADISKFFCNVLQRIKSDRTKNGRNNRVDFMQLMMDSQISESDVKNNSSQKGKEAGQMKNCEFPLQSKGLTDHEILSQAMTFMFAGYETTSSSLSFLAHNLATHPDIQKKLQEEVDKTFPDKGRPTYEGLMQMEYLDMVLNESLRLYPPARRLTRASSVTVEINGVTIPKGTVIIVPVYPLHRDPTLWPDPETFNPERFSKENKGDIDPYAFLPFGAGPRNCIGMRFALLMVKLAIVEILQNFSFVTCKETQVPLELGVDGFMKPTEPIKLKLEPRASAVKSTT